MKTVKYENLEIKDFMRWYAQLYKTYSGVLGAEWDKENKMLKIFYNDDAKELTVDEVKNIQIPIVIRFRKKLPLVDIPNVTPINDNEFIVETTDVDTIRKLVKTKYPEYEEVKE